MRYVFFILLSLSICSTNLSAAPSISSVTRTGDDLIIEGSLFGSHPDFNTSQPFLNTAFNDFEDGNMSKGGMSVVTIPENWRIATDNNRVNSTRYAEKWYNPERNHRGGALKVNSISPLSKKYYWSFNFKMRKSTPAKFSRIWIAPSQLNFYLSTGGSNTYLRGGAEYVPWGNSTTTVWGHSPAMGIEQWNRIEIYADPVDGGGRDWLGVAQGSVKIYINNVLYHNVDDWLPVGFDASTASGIWEVGGMLDPGDGGGLNYDDVYFSQTQARIEICNSSNWDARTLCEIQLPKVWGSTSITATARNGAFNAGADAYLYVVDSTGAVSPPKDIKIGSSVADTTPPVLINSNLYDGQTNVTKNGSFSDTWDESLSSASVIPSGLTFSNCGTVSGLTVSGNVVSGTFSGQSDSQTCTRTYSTAVENLAGINLTSPISRSFTTAAATADTCTTVDDLCLTESECLTAWPSNNWCEGETPTCKPEACAVELTCSYEYWGLCKTQLATEAIPGLYWDSRDGGFARTTPVPTDEIGPNLVENSDMSTWDTRIASGGYAAGYLPTYWKTYSTSGIERDSQGIKLTDTAHIIPDYLLVAGKRYRMTQQTYGIIGAWKFWWWGVSDVLNYTPGTHSVEFTMPAEPISDHGFYTGVTAGSVGVANHFQLYEVAPIIYKSRFVNTKILSITNEAP